MASRKKESSVAGDETLSPRPRLHKLIVRNFRCIGEVEIELDDIVVLVGPNNVGKSSILRAYEVVMSHGSSAAKLTESDFPLGQVDPTRLPSIELHTIVFDKAPGEKWLQPTDIEGEWLVREKWTWDSPNKDPKRQGFDVTESDWSDQVPWGAANVANSRRPQPHRIDAFATPEKHAAEITKLIVSILKDKLREVKSDPDQEKSDYELILDRIRAFQTKVIKEAESEIKVIEEEVSKYLSKLFPKHQVRFDARPDANVDATYEPFKSSAELLMGPEDGYFSTIAHQGSGARRTLLWAALKYLSEKQSKYPSRPHVLLLDEPEICLHPSAIREARSVLYDLPESGNWQVMITSHSPIFIDLSKDNTTIVRVHHDGDSVKGTTLYRPSRAKLDEDDKKNLKLMNICDPYVHEFFFGGRQVVVEGDTEYTAFSILKELYPAEYRDVQIIRARGKGIIPSIAKVLLQFSKGFYVLHDTDEEKTSSGKTNPAWSMNRNIAEILNMENAREIVNLVACKPCFEVALFGEEVKSDKPYNAFQLITSNRAIEMKVKQLLDYLLGDMAVGLPENCIHWSDIKQLG